MTRNERERLVEQYLEGSMDFAQEENFFIQVAIDEELRRTLKAYRIVEEAIRKEREVGAREHAGARRSVAAMLFATPQPETITEKIQSASNEGVVRKGRKFGTRRIAATLAAASVVLLGWLGIEQWTGTSDAATDIIPSASTASTPSDRLQPIQARPQVDDNNGTSMDASASRSQENVQQQVVQSTIAGKPEVRNASGTSEAPRTEPAESNVPESNRTPLTLRIDSTLRNPPRQEPVQLPVEIDWGSQKK